MRKNDLQRDKAFRQRLAQKLEVEQPPESYFQAVQSAFASLPDELPVKARPIHQRVLRTCAALAACCAVVVAGAFGLNQVSPQLMESMPGIGQIFQDFRVIQYSVHVATPACVIQIITVCPSVVVDGYRTFGNVAKQSCPPHVYLVALTGTVLA